MMTNDTLVKNEQLIDVARLSKAEHEELMKLGMLSESGNFERYTIPPEHRERGILNRRAVHAPGVLNEAYDYFPRPSSFSRALRFDLNGYSILLISGTASVDEKGRSVHVGDFRAQCWRTYRNISEILATEKMSWHDIVRTTCYLRDIERDYNDFNEIRTAFFAWLGLDPLPASTGIQARLCREDLLVEIEAIAIARC
ncbi:MAG: Rid family hydrolase [bacterium]